MLPGEICRYNFGPKSDTKVRSAPKVLQWNIERGYQLSLILAELHRIDADILILQELDIDCERTAFENVPERIAKELGLYGVFCCEFVELDSPLRSRENRIGINAGQKHRGEGLHGNAIFSKRPLSGVAAREHTANLDWSCSGVILKEPRRGSRFLLSCCVDWPAANGIHHFHCFNLHLEVFAGPLMRAQQLGDAISDAGAIKRSPTQHFLVFGDLNTMSSGIARLSPKYCKDRVRWMGLGETEGEWLLRHFISRTHGKRSINWKHRLFGSADIAAMYDRAAGMCFTDPFDVNKDTTIDNPTYKGWARWKLDWTLTSNCRVTAFEMGNHDFNMSDHKWLLLTIDPQVQPLLKHCSEFGTLSSVLVRYLVRVFAFGWIVSLLLWLVMYAIA